MRPKTNRLFATRKVDVEAGAGPFFALVHDVFAYGGPKLALARSELDSKALATRLGKPDLAGIFRALTLGGIAKWPCEGC